MNQSPKTTENPSTEETTLAYGEDKNESEEPDIGESGNESDVEDKEDKQMDNDTTEIKKNEVEKITSSPSIKKQHSIKHRLSRMLGTSKQDVHKETAAEIKRRLSTRPQEASRTCRDSYKPSPREERSTRKKNLPKKFDEYWMGSVTKEVTEEDGTTDELILIIDD